MWPFSHIWAAHNIEIMYNWRNSANVFSLEGEILLTTRIVCVDYTSTMEQPNVDTILILGVQSCQHYV